jgi:hypothetical protein
MAVPSVIGDLSQTAASNSPQGSEAIGSPGTIDDYLRAGFAFIAQLQALKANLESPTFSGNVGVGSAAPVWGAVGSVVSLGEGGHVRGGQVGGAGTEFSEVGCNLYFNSGWKYRDNGYGYTMYQYASNGTTVWSLAPNNSSGAGAAATLTSVMTLDNSGYLLIGYSSSNGAYKLQVNSQIFAANATIATSDGRYKENITPLNGSLELINALRPVTFTWKAQQDVVATADVEGKRKSVIKREKHNFNEGFHVGLIAQEVKDALQGVSWKDSIVKKNGRDAVVDADGNEVAPKEEFYGIAYTELIPLLIDAIQELHKKVRKLETP